MCFPGLPPAGSAGTLGPLLGPFIHRGPGPADRQKETKYKADFSVVFMSKIANIAGGVSSVNATLTKTPPAQCLFTHYYQEKKVTVHIFSHDIFHLNEQKIYKDSDLSEQNSYLFN